MRNYLLSFYFDVVPSQLYHCIIAYHYVSLCKSGCWALYAENTFIPPVSESVGEPMSTSQRIIVSINIKYIKRDEEKKPTDWEQECFSHRSLKCSWMEDAVVSYGSLLVHSSALPCYWSWVLFYFNAFIIFLFNRFMKKLWRTLTSISGWAWTKWSALRNCVWIWVVNTLRARQDLCGAVAEFRHLLPKSMRYPRWWGIQFLSAHRFCVRPCSTCSLAFHTFPHIKTTMLRSLWHSMMLWTSIESARIIS